jgi:hypothetical protein
MLTEPQFLHRTASLKLIHPPKPNPTLRAVVFEMVSLRNSLRVSPSAMIGLVLRLDSALMLKLARLNDLLYSYNLLHFGGCAKMQLVSSIGR